MTKEELKQGISELEAKFKSDKNALHIKYVTDNNTVKKGDTISDSQHSIVVERITYSMGFDGIPYCLYHGKWLTKSGDPNKRGEEVCIVQSNVKSNNEIS